MLVSYKGRFSGLVPWRVLQFGADFDGSDLGAAFCRILIKGVSDSRVPGRCGQWER